MRTTKAMKEIIRDVEAGDSPHWFSAETMAFFGSRIADYPVSRTNDRHNRRFFITQDDNYDRSERPFTIHYATTNPQTNNTFIATWGEVGQYATLGAAASAITNLFDLALDVGWETVVDMESLR